MSGTVASIWLPAASLWRREVIRFLRQPARVVGALGTPIVFWVLFGSGFGRSFAPPGLPQDQSVNFLEYAFPGTLALILLFTAIFSMISIIEDRKAGFLQAVIASPARRSAMVAGKVAGSTTLAMGQAGIFLLLAPFAGIHATAGSIVLVLGVMLLLSVALSGLGFLVAWPMDSTQGFHAIMNLVLMPMWFLSGALFPAPGAAGWVAAVMAINPLTYGVAALRQAMYSGPLPPLSGEPSMGLAVAVTLLFAALTMGSSVIMLEKAR